MRPQVLAALWLVPLACNAVLGIEDRQLVPGGGSHSGGTGTTSGGKAAEPQAGEGANTSSGGTDDPGSGGKSSLPGGSANGGKASGGSASGGTDTGMDAGADQGGNANGGSGGYSPCSDPVKCIDEVANIPSSFGNAGWKDSWWVVGCSIKAGHDCITNSTTCNSNDGVTSEEKGARTLESWTLGGEKGQHYKVTFRFSGVLGTKFYNGGTRDVPTFNGDPHTDTPLDTFYRDGASPESNYDVWKLTVYDDKGVAARHYYMNSAAALDWEGHWTYLAAYTKSIVVVGQGKVEHFFQDRNCHAIDNCGAPNVPDDVCPTPRKLPAPDDTLKLPAKYQDPTDSQVKSTLQLVSGGYPNQTLAQPWHAQAAHLTITAIEKTNDPVDKNY